MSLEAMKLASKVERDEAQWMVTDKWRDHDLVTVRLLRIPDGETSQGFGRRWTTSEEWLIQEVEPIHGRSETT
jgi:hypothetical protein